MTSGCWHCYRSRQRSSLQEVRHWLPAAAAADCLVQERFQPCCAVGQLSAQYTAVSCMIWLVPPSSSSVSPSSAKRIRTLTNSSFEQLAVVAAAPGAAGAATIAAVWLTACCRLPSRSTAPSFHLLPVAAVMAVLPCLRWWPEAVRWLKSWMNFATLLSALAYAFSVLDTISPFATTGWWKEPAMACPAPLTATSWSKERQTPTALRQDTRLLFHLFFVILVLALRLAYPSQSGKYLRKIFLLFDPSSTFAPRRRCVLCSWAFISTAIGPKKPNHDVSCAASLIRPPFIIIGWLLLTLFIRW